MVRSITSQPISFSRLRACDGEISWSTRIDVGDRRSRDVTAQLLALAGAEVGRRVEAGALLRERADDLEAQRLGELAQLGQRGLELDVAHAGQLHGRDDGALGLVFDFLHHGARRLSDPGGPAVTRRSPNSVSAP